MKKPILLIKDELLKPINQALERLEKIRQRKANNEDSIILEGLFVLANSTFENTLYDVIRVLAKHIPEKIDFKEEKISKEVLLSGNPLEQAIENKINNISYKNLTDILKYFIEFTSIPVGTIFSDYYDNLCEIKASRNLLIHNNLTVNSVYIDSAGNQKRSERIGEVLVIGQNYLFESIVTFKSILTVFKEAIELKYIDYTYINALRNLFNFIFNTPIMQFEDVFTIDESLDKIVCLNDDSAFRPNLSSSEELYLSTWLSHWQGRGINLNNANMYNLDTTNRKRFIYFLSIIDILK